LPTSEARQSQDERWRLQQPGATTYFELVHLLESGAGCSEPQLI